MGIWGLFKDLRPFQGFGAFFRDSGLFGDSGPFSLVDWLIDGFYPKILGQCWGPTKPFCGYVNGDWVGTVLPGGGDT